MLMIMTFRRMIDIRCRKVDTRIEMLEHTSTSQMITTRIMVNIRMTSHAQYIAMVRKIGVCVFLMIKETTIDQPTMLQRKLILAAMVVVVVTIVRIQ